MTTMYRNSSNLSDTQETLNSTLEEYGFPDITLHKSKASYVISAKTLNSTLEEYGFPDITLRKSKAKKYEKKSEHSQCADLRQWAILSVLVEGG